MTDRQLVLLEVDHAVGVITLNRPEVLNAIDTDMAKGFLRAIEKVEGRKNIRALLIKGEGRAFCAGGDIAAFSPGADHRAIAGATMDYFHAAILRLARLPIPTVAAVHGAVAGAGLSLAMVCDFALAAEDARFSFAYSRIGGTLDGSASWTLPRIVGSRKAKELALLSGRFDAREAERLGIVYKAVATDSLEAEARKFVRHLATGPTAAYAEIKALIDRSTISDLADQLDAERAAFVRVAGTADFVEGLAAFFGKREPAFRGE